jgi:hypothetical protein
MTMYDHQQPPSAKDATEVPWYLARALHAAAEARLMATQIRSLELAGSVSRQPATVPAGLTKAGTAEAPHNVSPSPVDGSAEAAYQTLNDPRDSDHGSLNRDAVEGPVFPRFMAAMIANGQITSE